MAGSSGDRAWYCFRRSETLQGYKIMGHWKGEIRGVRTFDRALSQEEIKDQYQYCQMCQMCFMTESRGCIDPKYLEGL